MHANIGDKIVVRGNHLAEPDREGKVVEVRGTNGRPPYRVTWDDGHESLYVPGTDATVERPSVPSPRV